MTDDVNAAETDAHANELPAPSGNPSAPTVAPAGGDWTFPISVGVMQLAGLASIGAGAIHAGVAGLHADHVTLTRLFVAVAVAQIGVGLFALVKGGKLAASFVVAVSVGAVAAWGITRLWGISWIDGLEESEAAQFTDTACAALGAIAAVAAAAAVIGRRTVVSTVRLGVPAMSVGAVALIAMLTGTNHSHAEGAEHSHDAAETVSADAASVQPTEDEQAEGDAAHSHAEEAAAPTGGEVVTAAETGDAVEIAPAVWPRAWQPDQPIDLSGVPGVTAEQQLRSTALLQNTLERLPQFADVRTIGALGFTSIGDSGTGYEHYINPEYFDDEHFLDPDYPESLVYRVNGAGRTLVSAMFMAGEVPADDPELVDYGGPLMTWHVHNDLCFSVGEDGPRVAGLIDDAGNCPEGTFQGGNQRPMVHVWIVPHECGPFAALEGIGAGTAASDNRTDQCAHEHASGGEEHAHDTGTATETATENESSALAGGAATGEGAAAAPQPFDPSMPIDLSGTPGVTPQQQAFAENLLANTLVNLPQWSDPAVAEEAGFRSIGDGATGHEHFVQWDWINDDVFLDPDQPESLVYAPQPDGTRQLVAAMFMVPESWALEDVPDWGGPLMQWHIHDNLCFDVSDPEQPRVGGLTDGQGGCTEPLVKLAEAPMIHVWITPHECGPFAALEGIGGGQIAEGEERLCDHAHGAGG
jgi:hypothetical protein